MKKTLSVVLALVLAVSTILIDFNSVSAQSSEAVLSDTKDNLITVFDSNAYVTKDPSTTNVNSNLVTTNDKGYWLGGNSWLSANSLAQDGLYMGKDGETAKILERNKAAITNVDDFEWQFQLIADNAEKINASFVFHAGKDANVTSYASRNNLFAVTLFGSEVDATKNCAVSNAVVVEYGGNGNNATLGNMRPFDYNSQVSPWEIKDNSFIKIDDNSATKKINFKKYITVKIKMEGRKITVAIWQSGDKESTYRELVVNMYSSVYNKFKSGDFAVISGPNTCNYRLKDMNISTSREIFTSLDYPAPGHVNSDIVTDTDAGLWLGAANLSSNVNNRAHLYLGSWKTTGEILSRNKADVENVSDFEWKFDYRGTDTAGNGNVRSAFMFHTNDKSDLSSYWNRNYAFSFMVWGSNWSYEGTANNSTKTHDAVPNSISLQVPVYSSSDASMMGKARPLNYTVVDGIRVPSEDSYLSLGEIDLSKWVTITVKMVGTKITLTVQQDDIKLTKDFTVQQNQLGLAPAGDFAIIQGGNQSAYKNMTVKTLQADIDVPKPEEPKDYEELPSTGVYYENDFEENSDGIVFGSTAKYPEQSGIKAEINGNSYLQHSHDYSNANGTDGWTIIKINPNKKYKDFTLNFNVKIQPELNANFHQNWHFLLVGFRSQNSINNSNVLQLSAVGAAFSVNDTSEGTNYTNNRIAYAGTDDTLGGTFDLPSGNVKAGLSPDGVWHKVSVVADGWKYKYYLDGVLMMEAEDKSKTFESGNIIILARSLTLQIDDVEILSPSAEISPFEPEQAETGLLYENTFDNPEDSNRLTVVRGKNYGIVSEGNKKYFHIDFEPNESNPDNGPVNIKFGPSGIKDFTMNMNVRINKKVSEKWHYIIPMGRTRSGISAQARLLTKGTFIGVQSDTEVLEVARSGPAAQNTTSPYPCHDAAYGISILEWHKISFVCEDWTYTVYIDGKKIVEGVDEHQLNKWGGFALRAEGVNLDIDNIRIWGVPHYDLDYTEEVPVGVLYSNNFEKSSLSGIEFVYYDDEKTAVLSEDNGNKFLRAYPNLRIKSDGKPEVVGNGNLLFTFGPPNAMDFVLTYKLRLMSNTNENIGSAIVGIHSSPANIKFDALWVNMLPRGTSFSLKNTKLKLGIDNLIATTGKNRNGGTAYMPSDSREKGIRPDGKWHDIKVVSKGYTYTVYIDGAAILSSTDKSKTFYKGYTVIGSNGCIIDVDNISLTNK